MRKQLLNDIANAQGKFQLLGKSEVVDNQLKIATAPFNYKTSFASVDLGSLNWRYVGGSYTAYAQLSEAKVFPSSQKANMYCEKYETYAEDNIVSQQKGISKANVLIIQDNTLGNTSQQIKQALSGVYLIYELTTPTTYLTNNPLKAVDLGTLNWNVETVSSGYNFYTNTPMEAKHATRVVCSLFVSDPTASVSIRNNAFISNTGKLNITANGYTNATDFKNAMSGVILYYEPTEALTLKSVGTIQDTYTNTNGIVERKIGVRNYQSGDENNPNVITDMTHTCYELATPTTETWSSLHLAKFIDGITDKNEMEIEFIKE